MLLTIVFSNHCNMACSYCCITNKNTSSVLSLDSVFSFIDQYKDKVDVIEFFGGEPTLHMNDIEAVIAKYPEFEYRLFTNLNFDYVTLDRIKLLRFSEIFASLDGATYEENKSRFHSSGKEESFARCLANLTDLCRHDSTAVTLGLVLFEDNSYSSLKLNVDFFRSIGVKSFAFEVATTIGDFHQSKFSLGNLTDLVDVCCDVGEMFVQSFFYSEDYGSLFSLPSELINAPFAYNVLKKERCSSSSRAISPRGNVYICRDHAANEEGLIKKANVLKFYKRGDSPSLYRADLDTFLQVDDSGKADHLSSLEEVIPCALKQYAANEHGYYQEMFWLDQSVQELLLEPLFLIQDLLYKCHILLRKHIRSEDLKIPAFLIEDVVRLERMIEAMRTINNIYKEQEKR